MWDILESRVDHSDLEGHITNPDSLSRLDHGLGLQFQYLERELDLIRFTEKLELKRRYVLNKNHNHFSILT